MKRIGIMAAAALIVLAGCGTPAKTITSAASTVGPGEKTLALLAWAGDTEYGQDDPLVNWEAPFENATGCKLTVRFATSVEQMDELMHKSNLQYDGVDAPPLIAKELIADKDVAPINPSLVSGYTALPAALRNQTTSGSAVYGVPYYWGVNSLTYNASVVKPAPTSWTSLFSATYAGRLIEPNDPTVLAEAAMALPASDGVRDPYELTPAQLRAAKALVAAQRPRIDTYTTASTDAATAFASGQAVLGIAGPYVSATLSAVGRPIGVAAPKPGTTGWVNSWMLGVRAQHENCMYKWLNYVTTPSVQAQVAKWNGVAPADPRACTTGRLTTRFCASYHVTDTAYMKKLIFAHSPMATCGDGHGGCTGVADWEAAWDIATGHRKATS